MPRGTGARVQPESLRGIVGVGGGVRVGAGVGVAVAGAMASGPMNWPKERGAAMVILLTTVLLAVSTTATCDIVPVEFLDTGAGYKRWRRDVSSAITAHFPSATTAEWTARRMRPIGPCRRSRSAAQVQSRSRRCQRYPASWLSWR